MRLLLFFILFFCSYIGYGQSFLWAGGMGGPFQDIGYGVTSDGIGNVYVTGHFYGTTDFDPGPGVYNMTPLGGIDVFILKLTPNGDFIWAKQFKGGQSGAGKSIAVDDAFNVYVYGFFESTFDFDPGPGTFNMTALWGSHDPFIAKLDSSGNLIWAERFGGGDHEDARDMVLDGLGNIIMTGIFENSADLDPEPGAQSQVETAIGGYDIYVVKIDSSGALIWAKTMGGFDDDFGNGIGVDQLGNVLVTGMFEGTCDFDPGGNNNSLTSNDHRDIFIVKLSSIGNYVWAKSIGGTGWDDAWDVTADSNGDVIVVGEVNESVDFDPSPGGVAMHTAGIGLDAFTWKLDVNGNYMWHDMVANPTGSDFAYSVIVDAVDCIYVTGQYYSNTYCRKLTSNGAVKWMALMNGGSGYGRSIHLDNTGSVLISGEYGATVDFDPGPGSYTLTSNSGNTGDIFVMKLGSTVGQKEFSSAPEIELFPNPVKGILNVKCESELDYSVLDIEGREVLRGTLNKPTINLRSLPSGLYIIRCTSDESQVRFKVIKE